MKQIADFAEERADGKLVPSTMSVSDMLDLGWGPSKVIALKWSLDGRAIEIRAPNGIHAIVVPGSNFVAAIYGGDDANLPDRLTVLLPDGSILGARWFEPAMTPQTNTLGVVFQTDEPVDLRCDVDASKLSVTNAIRIR